MGPLKFGWWRYPYNYFCYSYSFIINFNNTADKTGIKAFNREIHIMDIQRSFAVFTMASILTFVSMIIIAATEQGKLTFIQIFLR